RVAKLAALSYVWSTGSASEYRTRLASKLEEVIESAMKCTKQMGFRYLWTDRHCIDQHLASKTGVIQNMDQIYTNASITIIDAAGDSAESGLPGPSTIPRLPSATASVYGKFITLAPNARYAIAVSKSSTRRGTFQEGLLSRRRLVFTKEQVYFQRRRTHRC
ncbi:hypothetical protein BU25DRAFT_472294, partial [Macroventuria anomochaeta]